MLQILGAIIIGVVLGFFIPLWAAALLTTCWIVWLLWMYVLSYRGLTPAGHVFLASLVLGLCLFASLWVVYALKYLWT